MAFVELTRRTANIAEAEQIEMRLFGSPNDEVILASGQKCNKTTQNRELGASVVRL